LKNKVKFKVGGGILNTSFFVLLERKRNMKENTKLILVAIISIILSSTIAVTATTLLKASSVSYDNTTVDKALDELYEQVASKNSITSITLLSQTEFTQEEFI
jgi:hypothetical protein